MSDCLTAEAILSLPAGPELDALVAERVMGWRRGDGRYDDWWFDGDVATRYGTATRLTMPWRPSTDIVLALEVVERMVRQNRLAFGWTRLDDWFVCIGGGQATAPTLQLAICWAALLAVSQPADPGSG